MIGELSLVAIVLAIESEIMTNALDPAIHALGVSDVFEHRLAYDGREGAVGEGEIVAVAHDLSARADVDIGLDEVDPRRPGERLN